MTVSAKSLTACWIPPEMLMLLMLHIFVLEKSPNVAGFFFFFFLIGWRRLPVDCHLLTAYLYGGKEPGHHDLDEKSRVSACFCITLTHWQLVSWNMANPLFLPSPPNAVGSCDSWLLVFFGGFFTLKSCSLCPHTVSVVAQLLSISVFPLFPFTVTYLNLKLSFNSLSNSWCFQISF